MAIDFPFEERLRFAPYDDGLHPPGPEADWTETTWWSFHVAEASLAGWLYVQMRPNIGVATGGAFVYGPDAWQPWEHPYFAYQWFEPLPEPLDLRAVTFRNGVSVRCTEPGMRYELGYRFRDQTDLLAELVFEGLTPPVPHLPGAPPFTGSSHFDQHGRVTGTLTVRGETHHVDCVSVRDRSWGRRPELLGRRGRLSYCFGSTEPGATGEPELFLAFCMPPADDPLGDTEHLTTGYLLRDGVLRRLAHGTRRNRRDPDRGCVEALELEAEDVDGRPLHAVADVLARMFLPKHAVTVNSLLAWSFGDELGAHRGHGEDQEVWPTLLLGDMTRAGRNGVVPR